LKGTRALYLGDSIKGMTDIVIKLVDNDNVSLIDQDSNSGSEC